MKSLGFVFGCYSMFNNEAIYDIEPYDNYWNFPYCLTPRDYLAISYEEFVIRYKSCSNLHWYFGIDINWQFYSLFCYILVNIFNFIHRNGSRNKQNINLTNVTKLLRSN